MMERNIQSLEAEVHKLLQVAEQSPSTVVITDPEGKVDYVNPRFCELTGYSAAEVIGQNIRMLKLGDQPPEVYQELWTTIRNGKKWRGRFHNKRKDGQEYWEDVSIAPLRDEHGRTAYYIKLAEDITEQVKLEGLRDDLTHMIVHDLKNPLTGITSAVELLSGGTLGPVNDQQQKFLGIARVSYKKLLNLIMDLLEISKLEEDKLEVHPTRFSGRELAAALNWTTALAARENKGLTLSIPADLQITVDQNLLTRVIENLLTNALKHIPEGGKASLEVKEDAGQLSVQVTDNGEGIPAEYLGQVFDKFFKVSDAKMKSKLDTGLGLTFCKLAVEAHGGRIGVESKVGRGSRFFFSIPEN